MPIPSPTKQGYGRGCLALRAEPRGEVRPHSACKADNKPNMQPCGLDNTDSFGKWMVANSSGVFRASEAV